MPSKTQAGICCTSANAHLTYMMGGASRACKNGIGSEGRSEWHKMHGLRLGGVGEFVPRCVLALVCSVFCSAIAHVVAHGTLYFPFPRSCEGQEVGLSVGSVVGHAPRVH